MFHQQSDKFSLNEKENITENMEKFTLKVSGYNIYYFIYGARTLRFFFLRGKRIDIRT